MNKLEQAARQALVALEAATELIECYGSGYGFARTENPHRFCPDAAECSAEEIANHSAACDAYSKGEQLPKGSWGIGSYTGEPPKEISLSITALREALAEQAEQEPMKECRHCGFLCKPNPNESNKWYPLEQAEQEPVAYVGQLDDEVIQHLQDKGYDHSTPLYAAPVRTKDLTDDEICKANKTELPDCQDLVDFARAVIAADREKNK